MAISPTTQQALDQAQVSLATAGSDVRSALAAAISAVSQAASVAHAVRSEYQLAELDEDDLMVQPKLAGCSKTALRVADHCRVAEAACAKIMQAMRQLCEQDAELRGIARDAGYLG